MVVGLAAGLVLAGGGLVGYRKLTASEPVRDTVAAPSAPVPVAPPAEVRAQAPAPVTPPEGPEVPAGTVAETAAGQQPPVTGGGAATAVAAQAPVPDDKAAEDDEVKSLKPTPPKKRVSLGMGDIRRVVQKGSSRISSCFTRNREELPASEGKIQVEFSIASTGKVDARVGEPWAGTKVGRCVEVEAERLRFPAHRDETVDVIVPFAWTLK